LEENPTTPKSSLENAYFPLSGVGINSDDGGNYIFSSRNNSFEVGSMKPPFNEILRDALKLSLSLSLCLSNIYKTNSHDGNIKAINFINPFTVFVVNNSQVAFSEFSLNDLKKSYDSVEELGNEEDEEGNNLYYFHGYVKNSKFVAPEIQPKNYDFPTYHGEEEDTFPVENLPLYENSTLSSDIFSLGFIFYIFMSLEIPLEYDSVSSAQQQIAEGYYFNLFSVIFSILF
jgi:hypothetical protein